MNKDYPRPCQSEILFAFHAVFLIFPNYIPNYDKENLPAANSGLAASGVLNPWHDRVQLRRRQQPCEA